MKKTQWNRGWTIAPMQGMMAAMGGQQAEKTPVTLPHDAMIGQKRDASQPTAGGSAFFAPGNYDYEKAFTLEKTGGPVWLEIEGAYHNASVWVNGDFAGQWPYGYGNFQVKISDFLRVGKNTVKVSVKNTDQPNSRWYSGAGLYRDVNWIEAGEVHVGLDGVRVTTLAADEALAVLRVETDLENEGLGLRQGILCTLLRDKDGNEAAKDATRFTLRQGEKLTVRQRMQVEKPALWDLDSPNLYTCETKVLEGETVLDGECNSFGIRTLALDSVHGLRLNGKTVKLKGGCIHHDNGVLGSATFYDAEERRARLMKQAGYNALRSAHHPMGKAMLTACDRLGILVMDEFTDVWTVSKCDYDYAIQFPQWWERDVEAMVRKDYNHPCVVMYSTGNEIFEMGARIGNAWGRKIADKIRSLDDTRYLTNGINVMMGLLGRREDVQDAAVGMGGGDINEIMSNQRALMDRVNSTDLADPFLEEVCATLDIVGYNYAAGRYEREIAKYPYRVIVGSETAPAALDKNWELVEKHGAVIGDFTWTAWEYLGEVGIGRVRYGQAGFFYGEYPWVASRCADFDLIGSRRPVSYWRETVWGGRGHEPYIAVQLPEHYGEEPLTDMWSWTDSVSSWTWPGYEGKGIVAEVYCDAEEAELFLDGKSLGRKAVGTEEHGFYCKWETVYAPGMLEAVSYVGGKEAGRFALRTAGEPHVALYPEREGLQAGSNELCFVKIRLEDGEGNLCPIDRQVTLTVEGPGTLQGSGSADPKTEENYRDTTHMTCGGEMLAVLRAGEEAGATRLTVTAQGLEAVTVEIQG